MGEQKTTLDQVVRALKTVFPLFREKGALSFYLWGSLVREDYDPVISDIDLIFILSDAAEDTVPENIKNHLSRLLPDKSVGGQGVYMSELNGHPARSFFAKLHPLKMRSILSGFNEWRYVCGKKFIREDFSVPDLTTEEQISMTRDQALDIIDNRLEDPRRNWRKDLVKLCLRLGYLRAVREGRGVPLNFDAMPKLSLPEDRSIITLVAELRKNGDYRKEVFDIHTTKIHTWVASLMAHMQKGK